MNCAADARDKNLIVGASRGLGRAILDELRQQGRIATGVARTGEAHEMFLRDAAEPGIAAALLSEIKPSTLYICAAEGVYGERPTNTDLDRVIRSTLHLSLQWIQGGVDLIAPGGRIAWISSLSSLVPDPRWAVYGACKAAVEHYVRSIRQVAADKHIGITVCYPGRLATTFHQRAGAPPPRNAVEPRVVAADLISAVDQGFSWWAAPMDLLIVGELRAKRETDTENQRDL